VYIEVPYYQEGDIQGMKQGFGGARVDSVVAWVWGVEVNQPEAVKVGREERFLEGDIAGEDVIHPFEPRQYQKKGTEGLVNIGRQARLPDRGEK